MLDPKISKTTESESYLQMGNEGIQQQLPQEWESWGMGERTVKDLDVTGLMKTWTNQALVAIFRSSFQLWLGMAADRRKEREGIGRVCEGWCWF